MRIPLSWILEYIDIQQSPDQIKEILTSAGVEVDSIEAVDSDTVFELSLTPNLGHCSSILGIARELAAATKKPVKIPSIKVEETETITPKVTVKDFKRCPRYTCRVIKNIKVGPSPDWMQKRLIAAGLRPINNIVDITNYVLLEFNQPLHAFDYDLIEGGEIIVRDAKDGEVFATLDGKERKLTSQDLLICDAKKPIALAGVMGGSNSEVTENTKTVLLESAYFDACTIRLTSQRLGLQTDASKRFDRGIDPNMITKALDHAAMLMQGQIGKLVDKKESDFSSKRVTCRLSRVSKLLGIPFSKSEVQETFVRLGMEPNWDGQDIFTVMVPTYRNDITAEVDLIEEVARLYGYNNFPKGHSAFQASTIPDSPLFLFEKEIRERLRAEGLQEFLTCDLIGPQNIALLQQGEMPKSSVVKVLNAAAEEQSILRTSLLPGFLELVKYNQDHQIFDIHGFEIGRVYYKKDKNYGEQSVAGIVLTGKNRPHEWDHPDEEVDFYDLKGILENLFEQLGIENYTFAKSSFATLHDGRQASVFLNGLETATFGEVHPSILRQLDIKNRVLFAEINLQDLMQKRPPLEKMKPLPIYPCSERDWTLTLQEKTSVGDIITAIQNVPSNLLEDVTLLYLYRSEKLGADRKNVTFHFVYRDPNKTISQEAVEAEHTRLIDETMKTLKL